MLAVVCRISFSYRMCVLMCISECKRKQLHMPGAEEVSKQTPTVIQLQIVILIILALVTCPRALQLNTYTYSVVQKKRGQRRFFVFIFETP